VLINISTSSGVVAPISNLGVSNALRSSLRVDDGLIPSV
jgi:hypothetical protein